jgi:hypothetical protein
MYVLATGPVVNTSDSVGGVGRVACKYVIKPTLLTKKKFDVRFYLLVTSLSPLVISRHEAFVIRLSNEEYCDGISRFARVCTRRVVGENVF